MLYPYPHPHPGILQSVGYPVFTLSSGYFSYPKAGYKCRMLYPYPGYYCGRTQLAEVSGTGMDVMQNPQKFRYGYECRAKLTSL